MPLKPWFYRDFKPYACTRGVKLLRDDLKFIERVLCNLPESTQRVACRRYIEDWVSATPYTDNAGRYKANQGLMKIVARNI